MKKTVFIKSSSNETALKIKKADMKPNLLEAIASMKEEPEDTDKVILQVSYDEPEEEEAKKTFEETDEAEVTVEKIIQETDIDSYIRENTGDFIHDSRGYVRIQAAKRKYGLSTLKHDESSYVRVAVAETGYKPEEMIKDESKFVRAAVARTGYGLDILIKDNDPHVKAEVARKKYGLDILIKDNDQIVRAAVAETGYGWDILVNDEDPYVRLTIAKNSTENKTYLPQLANDLDRDVRVAVAQVADEDVLGILVNDASVHVRCTVAERGYGLEKLAEDEDSYVRAAAARSGQYSEKFITDENWHVRWEAANASGNEAFLRDSNPAVRKAAWDKIHENADGSLQIYEAESE